jgi:hypothetical protein
LFNIPYKEISKKLHVTEYQIWRAKHHRLTPQKCKAGRKALLNNPQKARLKLWLMDSPSHRRIPFKYIPLFLPDLNAGDEAIRTAFKDVGYCRRASKKKGFSDDPRVMAWRKAFAEQGIKWTREMVHNPMFSDEVWAMGGANTGSFVTVLEDGSDRYLPECLQHKYSKLPAWMVHGTIVDGRKGPLTFWEKDWGKINSTGYDEHILAVIAEFMQDNEYIYIQDNAHSHRSLETKLNLIRRGIRTIPFPPYSNDLNIIEHVWNWMKNWIQGHYWHVRYRPDKISLDELRRIIIVAWDAVLESYIQSLFDSWWNRCQAVINANCDPTNY